MPHPIRFLFAALLTGLMLAPRAAAQCTFADNLDGGPCCALTQAQTPPFPNFTDKALDICWRDCGIDQVKPCKATWTNVPFPVGTPIPCGEMLMRLDILNGANTLMWRGQMRLVYARTWLATDTQGFSLQVWRFLVNGDLRPFPAAGVIPCPVPPCVTSNANRARFTGYVDFALNCSIAGSQFEESWMLTHACDGLDHHTGFARAGVFHPDRSYTFVGPSAGFVPGPIQPTEGTLFSPFEDIRARLTTPPPVTIACSYEESSVHSLFPQQQLCFCGLPGSTQFLIANLRISGVCGTSIQNPAIGPLVPGYVSMGIGAWTTPNVYPGQQALRWNVGGYDYLDACIGTPQHEIFYGVTTVGGYPANQLLGGLPGPALPPIFIDQVNAQLASGATTMNVPFRSRHILNLNE